MISSPQLPNFLPRETRESSKENRQIVPPKRFFKRRNSAVPSQTLSKVSEENRALKRIAVFFVVMLLLTLIARGTSNAILPVVTTTSARAGTIRQTIRTNGTITAMGTISVAIPEGLLIEDVTVKEGQLVQEGQTLASINLDSLVTQLNRAKASLAQSQTKYQQLTSSTTVDATSVQRAQQTLERAYEAYAAANAALEQLCSVPEEEQDSEAIKAAQDAEKEAYWAAQQAEYDRNSALSAYQEAAKQNELSSEANQAAAQDVAIDIEETQNKVEKLQNLYDQQGVILSPATAVVAAIRAQPGSESGEILCSLYDSSKGFSFTCSVPTDEAQNCNIGLSTTITQDKLSESGSISAISENSETGTTEISVHLESSEWELGSANAEITLSEKSYDVCLPNTAIHTDSQGDFVFLLEERNTVLGLQNVLTRISVHVLAIGQSQSAVEAAISPNDVIAAESTRLLEAGAKVRVNNE